MEQSILLKIINDANITPEKRLEALSMLDKPVLPEKARYVNNHIHTTYSFSPYTPTAAVYYAALAGLSTAGIMDHDSVGGTREFISAAEIIGMPATIGFECRTSVEGTELYGLRLNNPDQKSVAYVTMHGIPHTKIDECEAFLAPLREKRNLRNIKMCDKIAEVTGISLDFASEVLPLSQYKNGGSVTERHVLFALTKKLIADSREKSVQGLEAVLGKPLPDKTRQKFMAAPTEFFEYDVLGILKSSLVSKIYVDADDELVHITEFTAFAKKIGAICAYAYLGDVTESPTGDKKAQKFEDDYLDTLIHKLHDFGFDAVTYMPSRNTSEQIERIIALCDKYGFFQVSGEDINSPRQSFVCPAMAAYPHLFDSTYALIGHERAATLSLDDSMFSTKTITKIKDLNDRINYYAAIGRNEEFK